MNEDAAGRTRSALQHRPLTASVLYSLVASFPVFFAGAYAVRLQDDLGLSTTRFGWAVSGYFISSALGSFTIGRRIDRLGVRTGFIGAALGGSIASVGVAASTSLLTLGLALAVAGLANTAGQLASNRLLAGLQAARQGVSFGVKQAAVPIGGLGSGLIVGLAGDGLSWRAAFGCYAVAALILAFVAPSETVGPTEVPSRLPIGADWPFLTVLAFGGAFAGAAGNALAVLAVDSFDAAGFDERMGAAALAVGSAVTIVGRIGLGWLAGRRGGDGFAELGAAMALGAAGFGLLAVAGTNAGLLWAGTVVAFLAAWGWPGVMYFTAVRAATSSPATASSVVTAGVFGGGIIGAPLMGAISDTASYSTAWGVAAAMMAVAAGSVGLARVLTVSQRPATDHLEPVRSGPDQPDQPTSR